MKAYEKITTAILEQLEKGKQSNWTKPWLAVSKGLPKNTATEKSYNGINSLLLLGVQTMHHTSEFATYKQLEKEGYTVKKGSKGYPVVYFNFIEKTCDKTEKTTKTPFARQSYVFNLDQTNEYTKPEIENVNNLIDIDACNDFIKKIPANVENMTNERAFFSLNDDVVNMPNKNLFDSIEEYYSTFFHELVHWTGHNTRLDRDMSQNKEKYAFEEFIAELGASFLCARFGLENKTRENHVQYLDNWLDVVKRDKSLIVKASKQAQKAVDYLLAYQ